ncbi:hypothetical protein BX666DRAFT_1929366 [Dichotomocladium elegans]|nr:hypothetical protein BX666DRAFT_1929366 [Dichotomocladium elegans]
MIPRYRSQEMLRDLFAEINDYLEDSTFGSAKTTKDERSPDTFHPIVPENDEEYQGPVLLESDDDEEEEEQPTASPKQPCSFTAPLDPFPETQIPENLLLLCPVTEERRSVCTCYDCSRGRRASLRPSYETTPSPPALRPDSTGMCMVHNNGSRLNGFADRIRQSLTTPVQQGEIPRRRERRSSSSSSSGNSRSRSNSAILDDSRSQPKQPRRWMLRPRSLPSLKNCVKQQQQQQQQQEPSGPPVSTCRMSWSSSPASAVLPPVEHRYPSGHTSLRNGDIPFLTPSTRTGREHIALRMKECRMLPTRDERLAIYTNAYYDCIIAKSNLIPWLTKQYSKGPPDAMFEYTPPERKQPKSILSFFKRPCNSSEKPQKQQHMQPLSAFIVSTASPSPAATAPPLSLPLPPPIYSQQQPYAQQQQPEGAAGDYGGSSTASAPTFTPPSSSDTTSTSSSDLLLGMASDDMMDPMQPEALKMQAKKQQRPVSILKKSKSTFSLLPPSDFSTTALPPREHLVYPQTHKNKKKKRLQKVLPPPYRRHSYYRDGIVDDFYDDDGSCSGGSSSSSSGSGDYGNLDRVSELDVDLLQDNRSSSYYYPPDPRYYDDLEPYDDEPPYYYHEPLAQAPMRRRRPMFVPRPRSAYVETQRRYYDRPPRVYQY